MTVAHVKLTDSQFDVLQSLAVKTGKTEDELVNEAVSKFIEGIEKSDANGNGWREAMHAAKGLWKDRDDLPDFEALRKEWDRSDRWRSE
jgi:predicted DNA-binding protein